MLHIFYPFMYTFYIHIFQFNRNHTIEREAEVRDAPLSTAEVLERTSIDHNERQQVATTSNDRIEDNKRAKGYCASQR